jgi:DNA-binding transcriptional LysR family regulator
MMDVPDPVPVAAFAELPKIVREEGSFTRTKMKELLADAPKGHDFVAELSSTTAVNEAVAAGLGVSLVPERSAKAWVDAGSVRMLNVEGIKLFHEFYVIFSQQRYITPAARAFIEHLESSRQQ